MHSFPVRSLLFFAALWTHDPVPPGETILLLPALRTVSGCLLLRRKKEKKRREKMIKKSVRHNVRQSSVSYKEKRGKKIISWRKRRYCTKHWRIRYREEAQRLPLPNANSADHRISISDAKESLTVLWFLSAAAIPAERPGKPLSDNHFRIPKDDSPWPSFFLHRNCPTPLMRRSAKNIFIKRSVPNQAVLFCPALISRIRSIRTPIKQERTIPSASSRYGELSFGLREA